MIATVLDYLALTKPRVLSLLLWTTFTAMIVAQPDRIDWAIVGWTMLGGYMAAGGAGAINHYLDRDRDAQMHRTRGRPVVTGRIAPRRALIFGLALGAGSIALLALAVNPLTAALALTGLLGYAVVYTIWLKPSTPQNIVLGGAAGSIPPLVGWAAATGGLAPKALALFAIVFFWTPPHFWALSLLIVEDYARTGVPMMPVVRGEPATRRLILGYSLVVVAVGFLPVAIGLSGLLYGVCAAVLGAGLVGLAAILLRSGERRAALRLYLYSLVYLALLFGALAVDAVVA